MKKLNKNLKSNNKGITLIALIITIVVMLIIAVISIRLVFGEDGIIARAKYGVNRMKIAQYKEEIEIALAEEEVNAQTGKNLGNKFSYENVWNRLRKNDPGLIVSQEDTQEDIEEYIITYNKFKYKIDKDKKVTYIGDTDKEEVSVGKYTITYHKNDGTDAIFEQIVDVGKEETLTLDKFTRGGYTLEGWYSNAQTTGDKITKASSAIDVYAKWNEIAELINLGRTQVGDITYEESYEIWNKGQLSLFRDRVNDEENPKTFEHCILKIMDNIDTSSDTWVPIGYHDGIGDWTGPNFAGMLDGNDKKVTLSNFNSNSKYKTFGFLGMVIEGTVCNLNIAASTTLNSNKEGVAGIVGAIKGGKVSNCTNEANITCSQDAVGGIVGYSDLGSIIENCTNKGKITGLYLAGGIIGWQGSGTITGCKNINADIHTTGVYPNHWNDTFAGGIVGYAGEYGNITISYCENSGKISSANQTVGGIAGAVGNDANYTSSITNCTNSGNIEGSCQLGGIAGWAGECKSTDINSCIISDCSNNGTIRGIYCIGGIIGSQSNGIIKDCNNSNSVTSYQADANGDSIAGGIVGWIGECGIAKIQNCENSGQINSVGCWAAGIVSILGNDNTTTYEIENCKNYGSTQSQYGSSGIVGWISKGSVKNCQNINATIKTANHAANDAVAGGILAIGDCRDTSIENCHNSGNITSCNYYAGGICGLIGAGYNSNFAYSIQKCSNTGKIKGLFDVGGIVGRLQEGTISECYNTNEIEATNDFAGGICGEAGWWGDASITSCYNKGNIKIADGCGAGIVGALYTDQREMEGTTSYSISDCYNTGTVTGGLYIGGIAGYTEKLTIKKCYNTNTISTTAIETDNNSFVGGIIAWIDGEGIIEDCYNKGNISGQGDCVAGICSVLGNDLGKTYQVKYCYNLGTISSVGCNDPNDSHVQEIIGYANKATITKCYWTGNRYVYGTYSENATSSNCSQKSVSDFQKAGNDSSSVTYLLNNGRSGIWAQSDSINEKYPYLLIFNNDSTWKIESGKNNGDPYLKNNQPR